MCECPVCLLFKANTQARDVLVKFEEEDIALAVQTTGDILTSEQHLNLIKLVIIGRDNWKLKVDEGGSEETETYSFNVEKLRRNLYKVCFHKK
jgi:hypothetical protein